MRKKLGLVNFRKDVWDCYYGLPSKDPRTNCGTHFGSSSLFDSKMANSTPKNILDLFISDDQYWQRI